MRPPDDRVSDFIAKLPGGRRSAAFVAVGIAALALLVLIVVQGAGSKSPVSQAESTPFYLEAQIVVLGVAQGTGPRPQDSKSTLIWWYARPGVWHWQLDFEPTEGDPLTFISVGDGKSAYLYASDTNAYTKVPLKDYKTETLPVSAIIGPVDVAQTIAGWEAKGTTVTGGGTGLFMGRQSQVTEYSPTWRTSGEGGDRQGGIGRIWVDDETGLVLRNLVDGGSTMQYLDGRITLLDLDPKFDAGIFDFDPPIGATQTKTD